MSDSSNSAENDVKKKEDGRYVKTIETLFKSKYKAGMKRVPFQRKDFLEVAKELGFENIKNLGDIVYAFRYRRAMPKLISETAPEGYGWALLGTGDATYEFRLVAPPRLTASKHKTEIKIPDATPEIFKQYTAGMDEQALLTKVRYNRIIDIFTGLTCYSLQNHYRTKIESIGQIEIDEIYVGISKNGAHYIMPCQAKSPNEKFGFAQVYQDLALCQQKYPHAICKPIGLQFKNENVVAVIQIKIEEEPDETFQMTVSEEKHYRLVSANSVHGTDLTGYLADENAL